MMRASGILLPISSIPSNYGIGCFSKEAYAFVDQLAEAGQKYWQILPLGPTGYGDSPYQSFSTFAGNPYFIDLEELIQRDLLTAAECAECDWGGSKSYVDYEKVYLSRFSLLRKAYRRFYQMDGKEKELQLIREEMEAFEKEQGFWLADYCLYMAVKDSLEGISWNQWSEDLKTRKPETLAKAREELKEDISFYAFQQFWFYRQWNRLKKYANDRGIKIIGDLPIYVAFDGADAWANPDLFQFDEEATPVAVAGCPPDAFSATGQLWGNPLYNWEYHKKTDYEWWMKRLRHNFMLYDILRLDHFRGFDEYFEIPAEDETAVNGEWVKGPGMDFFEAMKKELGEKKVIAENLGFLTDSVHKLLDDTGFPGMNVLEFAFGAYDDSIYLPHKYKENSVVYTGTHDNDTVVGWYETLSEDDKKFLEHYLKYSTIERTGTVHLDLISLALESRSDMVIIPLQDYLGLGNEARINTPSTVGGNWEWRVKEEQLTDELKELIRTLTIKYRTVAEENAKKAAEEAQQ